MKQQKHHICCDSVIYDGLPPITAQYPWLVAQRPSGEEDGQIFCNLQDPLSKYHCRIPELLGKRIRGCFHGWLILSDHPHNNNLMFSLWNPDTSKIKSLPPLILEDGDYESIRECCLSSSPDDPSSVLLFTRTNKSTFVFMRLNCKRNKLRWIEMSYDKQLKRITGQNGLLVYSLACCNGKVYAINSGTGIATFVIKVDILVKDREVLIKLSLFGVFPHIMFYRLDSFFFLKGSCTELYCIEVGFHDKTQNTPCGVYLFKLDMAGIKKCEKMKLFRSLDMTSTSWMDIIEDRYDDLEKTCDLWKEVVDLKDAIFLVDISGSYSFCYSSTISSKFAGYIHIQGKTGDIIYSYHVKKRTISLSSMPFPMLSTSQVSMWECRLEEDRDCEIVVRSVTDQNVELNESHLLNLPFPILESIMELCVGVEYVNIRAASKLCHLAAPLKQNETELERLRTYSLVSPWLVVVDKNQGGLTFSDPIFGGNYYMKNLQVSIRDSQFYIDDKKIYCSRFGWLLFYHDHFACLVLFNPFTSQLRKLPDTDNYLITVCFSAPPTSPDCMVVGFSKKHDEWHVSIHSVARESSWRTFSLGSDPHTLRFPTFKDRDLFALGNEGKVIVFKDLGEENYSWKLFEAQVPRGCCKSLAKYYLTKCDQHLILVVVGEFGEHVEVFKWNDATEEWEKIDSLGRHVIFIDWTTCICIEAKIREIENRIYFPRLHSENGKIVFYSLETCMYRTFNGKNIEGDFEDFMGTDYHLNENAWIEPNWS